MTSVDGTTRDITITITGTNDVPIISGELAGSVTEDVSVDANNELVDRSSSPVASGQMSITDVDDGEAFFNADDCAPWLTDDRCGGFVGV